MKNPTAKAISTDMNRIRKNKGYSMPLLFDFGNYILLFEFNTSSLFIGVLYTFGLLGLKSWGLPIHPAFLSTGVRLILFVPASTLLYS